MNVGDYVRTKSNGIQKIDEEGRVNLGLIRPTINIIKKEEIIKSSPNIIDLIEVGDFLDNHCIEKIEDTTIFLNDGWFIDFEDVEHLVTTITTHEQFENIGYKVGEIDG